MIRFSTDCHCEIHNLQLIK